jgi:hypothetical protein
VKDSQFENNSHVVCTEFTNLRHISNGTDDEGLNVTGSGHQEIKPHPGSGRKAVLFKATLVLTPFLVVVLVAEGCLRLSAARVQQKNREALAALYADRDQLLTGMLELPELLCASEYPRVIYRLRSGLNAVFRRGRVSTDENGSREPAPPPEKAAGTFRIVGLGDSSMFGWGVDDDETYLTRLTQRLTEHFSPVRWEALNTVVPGYNTVMEVETLRRRALHYGPDLVLVHYVGNDRRLPYFLAEASESTMRMRCHLWTWLRTKTLRRAHPNGDRVPQEVPAAYRDMDRERAVLCSVREIERNEPVQWIPRDHSLQSLGERRTEAHCERSILSTD